VRKLVVLMQSTLNNRIANAEGAFWEPFPWGAEEMAYVNDIFRRADTWVLSRRTYEVIVPWWDTVAAGDVPSDVPDVSPVDREFARIQRAMSKVVISSTLDATGEREVIAGDTARALAELKARPGRDIIVSAGPRTLAPLADAPGLIDEYILAVHPAVIVDGPRLFDGLTRDLALELRAAKVFDGGCVILRYAVSG
jgi:dihydrofolate reductase